MESHSKHNSLFGYNFLCSTQQSPYQIVPQAFCRQWHLESCHPLHVVKNLPIGEYIRSRRAGTSTQDYSRECEIIDARLRKRGFSSKLLNRAKRIANSRSRHCLLFGQTKHSNPGTSTFSSAPTFVTGYSEEYNKITHIIVSMYHSYIKIRDLSRFWTRGLGALQVKQRIWGTYCHPVPFVPPPDPPG